MSGNYNWKQWFPQWIFIPGIFTIRSRRWRHNLSSVLSRVQRRWIGPTHQQICGELAHYLVILWSRELVHRRGEGTGLDYMTRGGRPCPVLARSVAPPTSPRCLLDRFSGKDNQFVILAELNNNFSRLLFLASTRHDENRGWFSLLWNSTWGMWYT